MRLRLIHGLAVACLLLPLPALATPQATAFGNDAIGATWQITSGKLSRLVIHDHVNHVSTPVDVPFRLVLKDGTALDVGNLTLTAAPQAVRLTAEPQAARAAARLPGKAIQAEFADPDGRFAIAWRLVQPKDAHYLREIVTIKALRADEAITRVELMAVTAADAEVVGSVDGSPVVAGHDWFAFEHPMAKADAFRGHAKFWIERTLPLKKGHAVTYSAVAGQAHANQLRRDFAAYVERERAHPYRPFLHYNSWYDIGYFTPYTATEALQRIDAFGNELTAKRSVKLDSFLFDDGWDDLSGAWHFSKAFPHGFKPLAKAAARYGAAPGIWLSPWGGYGKPHDARIANARKLGYGIVADGLALSAPKYWQRFHAVVMDLLQHDGINQFKFDGTGNVASVYPGSQFDSDFAAAIQLIDDIRAAKPATFINLTTGTWASPFWLRYADSIWRDGYDHNFTGVGTPRQRWITYRDRETYRNIVVKGPLFPLNSLMLHGIIYARHARGLDTDPGHDFAAEVHSYFATGTDLEELYITPDLLTGADWDTLASAAKWARANAGVLRDTHWIGGDPGRLQVYGWAAWTPAKAFVTLRNPAAKPQLAVLDLARQLELPPDAARHYRVTSVWTPARKLPATLDATQSGTLQLAPFEVLTLQLTPVAATP